MKICLYSCNFGNYRNELKNGIDEIKICDNIDYYFFTDDNSLKSEKWTIVQQQLIDGENIMDSYRCTSKYIKFVTPDIIKKYDVIIWCDSQCLVKRIKPDSITQEDLNNVNSIAIESFFKKNDYKLVNVKHSYRVAPQEELKETMLLKFENISNGERFLNEIREINYDTPLPETCFIIRKNDELTNQLFEFIYKLLKDKGLKRDQNIYNHAIHTFKYNKDEILFIKKIQDIL